MEKSKPQSVCDNCKFDPTRGSQEEMTGSIYLSVERFSDPAAQEEYRSQLAEYGRIIQSGGAIDFDRAEMARIRNTLSILAQPLRPTDWLKILALILALLAIPIIAIIVFLLRHR